MVDIHAREKTCWMLHLEDEKRLREILEQDWEHKVLLADCTSYSSESYSFVTSTSFSKVIMNSKCYSNIFTTSVWVRCKQ